MTVAQRNSGRLHALDGLRGLAALSVVITHYAATFFPIAVFGAQGVPGHEWQDALSRSPFFALYSGSYAVFIFFALSGLVIAKSASGTKVPMLMLVGRRYSRLTIPALASTVLAYLLFRMFPDVTQEVASNLENGWLSRSFDHPLGIKQAVVDGVFNPYRYGHTYSNSVLWTMQAELFGSLGIYLLYRLVDRRYVPWVLVALFVLLIPQGPLLVRFLGFVGGALIYEALVNGAFSPNKVLFGFTSLFLGFLLGGLPSQPATGTNFGPLEEFVGSFSSPFEFILGMAALFTVMGVVNWGGALKALEFRWFRFLGRISFGVYLTHWPILATLILFIYLNIGYSAAGFLILSMGYFSLVIVAAYLFTVAVDEPTIHLLRWAKTNPVWVLGYFMHAVIVPLALGFVVSRLGYDVGALLVWSIAYTGLCITLPRALLNHPRMKSSINLFGRMAAGFVMNSRK